MKLASDSGKGLRVVHGAGTREEPRVSCASQAFAAMATLQQAAAKMRRLNIGSLPVCDGDRLIGMLTDRDITVRAVAEGCDPTTTTIREAMTPDIAYCFDDQGVQDAIQVMERYQIRRLPILTRDKRLVRMVSLGDLAVSSDTPTQAGETLKQVTALPELRR